MAALVSCVPATCVHQLDDISSLLMQWLCSSARQLQNEDCWLQIFLRNRMFAWDHDWILHILERENGLSLKVYDVCSICVWYQK